MGAPMMSVVHSLILSLVLRSVPWSQFWLSAASVLPLQAPRPLPSLECLCMVCSLHLTRGELHVLQQLAFLSQPTRMLRRPYMTAHHYAWYTAMCAHKSPSPMVSRGTRTRLWIPDNDTSPNQCILCALRRSGEVQGNGTKGGAQRGKAHQQP